MQVDVYRASLMLLRKNDYEANRLFGSYLSFLMGFLVELWG